jgi:hypothetical protein
MITVWGVWLTRARPAAHNHENGAHSRFQDMTLITLLQTFYARRSKEATTVRMLAQSFRGDERVNVCCLNM